MLQFPIVRDMLLIASPSSFGGVTFHHTNHRQTGKMQAGMLHWREGGGGREDAEVQSVNGFLVNDKPCAQLIEISQENVMFYRLFILRKPPGSARMQW